MIDDANKKISDTSRLVKKSDYDAYINDIEGKVPSITGLATRDTQCSNLFKKTDYDAKISDIETEYFTISDYNKFTGEILDVKFKKKELIDNSDVSGFIENSNLEKNIATLATKAKLK